MFLGCLIDAGWSVERLRYAIASLKLNADEWSIDAREVMKGPLRATFADVQTSESHAHRHLADITAIISVGDLPDAVKKRAIAVFTRLAAAEAKVHGTTIDKIHFHEVGAIDAIIDIVGSCAGLHDLGISKVYASPFPLAAGWAKTEHGQIPLPAPATLELIAAAKAPSKPGPGAGEWVTPTGAALLCEVAEFTQPAMTLEKIGTGAGSKETPWPNVARMWLGHPSAVPHSPAGSMVQLETNIDDMNPQLFADVSEKLFAAGAKDVWFTPIQMKKNRPAVLLSALGNSQNESALSRVIFEETTTLGVRVHALHHRNEAKREMREIETPHGKVRVKIKWLESDSGKEAAGCTPEYDDCKSLADAAGIPTRTVWESATAIAQALLTKLRTGK
jgi:uncharacterized protein (TIGR00299 family) protein